MPDRRQRGTESEQGGEQRAFWLRHVNDGARLYALGVERAFGALALWLDPETGQCRFGGFASAGAALHLLGLQWGSATPLTLVWDDRPVDSCLPLIEEELLLTKPTAYRSSP